jgi:inner membrane protein
MPSPLGHILAGTAVYLIGTRRGSRSRLILSATLLGSILPDFDFLPGIWIGDLRAFHHGVSHSLAFAVLFGLLVFFFTPRREKDIALRAGILAAAAYASHVILDLVSVNEGTRGVPMLWPLSDQQFGLKLHLLGYFHYSDRSIWSVIRWDNVSALSRELVVIGSLVLLLLWGERRSTPTPR